MILSRKIAKLLVTKNVPLSDVVTMLTKYKMLALLPAIKNAVEELSSQGLKRDTVMIESPFPLPEDSVKKIKRIIGNDIAPHEVTINKNILSGFKARFKEKLYDASGERIIKDYITS